MGSAPGIIPLDDQSSAGLAVDCSCLPSSFKQVLPPPNCSPPLSLKKIKLDPPAPAAASLCICSSNQAEDESEDEADVRPGSFSMAIGERLSTLQHLLPQGLELEEEEVLKVAIEYVRELEREIQMFHSSIEGYAKLEQSMSDSPLQRRGLCIVPLSTLAKAL